MKPFKTWKVPTLEGMCGLKDAIEKMGYKVEVSFERSEIQIFPKEDQDDTGLCKGT